MPFGRPVGGGNGIGPDHYRFKGYTEQIGIHALTGSDPTATLNLDFSTGNVFDITLDKTITTFTFSNMPDNSDAKPFTVYFRQDGTGSRTITWPVAIKWNGGTAATLSTDPSAYDVISFVTVDEGTTFDAFIGGQAFA